MNCQEDALKEIRQAATDLKMDMIRQEYDKLDTKERQWFDRIWPSFKIPIDALDNAYRLCKVTNQNNGR